MPLTPEEEQESSQLAADLCGDGAEPLTENQYRAIRCVVDERDRAFEAALKALPIVQSACDALGESCPENYARVLAELQEMLLFVGTSARAVRSEARP